MWSSGGCFSSRSLSALLLAVALFFLPLTAHGQNSSTNSPASSDPWTRPLLLSQMLVEQTGNLVADSIKLQQKISDWESFWQTQGPLLWQAQESQARLQTQLDESILKQSELTISLSSLQTSLDASLKSLGIAQGEAKKVLLENSLLKIGLYIAVPVAVVGTAYVVGRIIKWW